MRRIRNVEDILTFNIRKLIWMLLYRSGISNLFSDVFFSSILYYCYIGRKLNLENPTEFNEKIQWLKLYYKNPQIIRCVDKYEVRQLVSKRMGDEYLSECIGVFDGVEDIKFELLPRRFVLKSTHGSGWNIICQDKSRINWKKSCCKMKKWLKSDFSKVGREWQYAAIKPRIICEKYIDGFDNGEFLDFRLFTFNGKVKYILVEFYKKQNASKGHTKVGANKPSKIGGVSHYTNFYTENWDYIDNVFISPGKTDPMLLNRPDCLDEMKEMAEKVASGFPFCRVDFYVLNGRKPIFSELTFTPGKGCYRFNSKEFSEKLGSCIELPKKGGDYANS